MRTWSLPLLSQVLRLVLGALHILAAAASAAFKSRATLHLENLALRHQLGVLRRSVKRPALTSSDRLLWAWLCGFWSDWRSALVIVKPETVIGWHRKGFRLYWTWKVRHVRPGRPAVSREVRKLIRTMSRENPLWGGTPHPRRIAQSRHRCRRDQRRQVHRTQSEAAVAKLADIPGESREDHGVGRLLHRPDHPVSGPVRVPGPGSRPKADRAFQRHRPSDGGVDRAATARGLSL